MLNTSELIQEGMRGSRDGGGGEISTAAKASEGADTLLDIRISQHISKP